MIKLSARTEQIHCCKAYGYWGRWLKLFDALGCFYQFFCQEARSSSTEEHKQREKKEAKRWKAKTIYRRERLHGCPSVGIWTLETLQDWSWTYGALEKIFPKEASIEPWSLPGDNKIRRNVWLPTVWYQFSRNPRKTIWKFAAVYQKANVCRQDIGPIKHEYAAKQRLMSNHDEYWILALS